MMMTMTLAPALTGYCFSHSAIWHSEKNKEAFDITYVQPNHEGVSYDNGLLICIWFAYTKQKFKIELYISRT